MTRDEQIKALEKDWAGNPRWTDVERGYSAADVVRLRGSIQPEHTYARRGAEKLWDLVHGSAKKGYVNCMGAITAGQAMQQAKAGIEAIYLSGWQVAADGNTSETMSSFSTSSSSRIFPDSNTSCPPITLTLALVLIDQNSSFRKPSS